MLLSRRQIRSVVVLLLLASVSHPRSLIGQISGGTGSVTLQAGDLLKIEIWREPDLSGQFPIDEGGRVILPLLGERHVTHITMGELRDLLLEEYRQQLRNPSITIIPLRRIHVLGEVVRPGLYEVDPTVTLAAAVAMAGGANSIGDLNRIHIVRGSEVILERIAAGEALGLADVRSGDQIFVGRRSWMERNSTFVISMAVNIPAVVVGFIGLVNLIR